MTIQKEEINDDRKEKQVKYTFKIEWNMALIAWLFAVIAIFLSMHFFGMGIKDCNKHFFNEIQRVCYSPNQDIKISEYSLNNSIFKFNQTGGHELTQNTCICSKYVILNNTKFLG